MAIPVVIRLPMIGDESLVAQVNLTPRFRASPMSSVLIEEDVLLMNSR